MTFWRLDWMGHLIHKILVQNYSEVYQFSIEPVDLFVNRLSGKQTEEFLYLCPADEMYN